MPVTADERLDRTRRIRKRQDFLRIQSGSRKKRSNHILLAYSSPRVTGQADSRIGITVTRKVDKRAARRNRFKRRVREFFRRERLKLTETVDLVVIAGDLGEDRFCVAYGRDGRATAVLAVNMAARVVRYRRALADGVAWSQILEDAAAPGS